MGGVASLSRIHRRGAGRSRHRRRALRICGHLPKAPLPDASEPPWLSAAQAILVRDYFKPYSLRALADEIHVDPSHLARTFYRFKGCTAGDFVNRVRAQAACRRLGELGDPLEAIAKSTGFSDQSHMTRDPAALRKHAGVATPCAHACRGSIVIASLLLSTLVAASAHLHQQQRFTIVGLHFRPTAE